jgi:hypothetical protein
LRASRRLSGIWRHPKRTPRFWSSPGANSRIGAFLTDMPVGRRDRLQIATKLMIAWQVGRRDVLEEKRAASI